MESKATALGPPVHQMLVVFPLGLLATAVVFDTLRLVTGNTDFSVAAAYAIATGVAISGVTGWLGGELVDRLGVGVHDGAGLDAPSSQGWQKRERRSWHVPHMRPTA